MPTDTQNGEFAQALLALLKGEQSQNRMREGDMADVVFIKDLGREAYFDLGRFGTGIVFGAEYQNARSILKGLEAGTTVPAKIIDLDGENGFAELSLAEAGKQRQWQQVQELLDSGEIVNFKVTGANAGGLLGTLCELKAFLPSSQLSNDHQPKTTDGDRQKLIDDLKQHTDEELSVKVINVNPRSNKLIVSERETLSANVKELLTKYEVGQLVDGVVSGLADFGIFIRFVDDPEIEGLVHISEIDHRIIDNPKEIMKLNEAVEVKVIDIREGRVFLSLKALKDNPWDSVAKHFKEGQEVSGTVYKFNPFGATIDLDHGIQGLIHISEFGGLDEMKKVLTVGERYGFVVDSLKPEEKRLILKYKK